MRTSCARICDVTAYHAPIGRRFLKMTRQKIRDSNDIRAICRIRRSLHVHSECNVRKFIRLIRALISRSRIDIIKENCQRFLSRITFAFKCRARFRELQGRPLCQWCSIPRRIRDSKSFSRG